MTTPRPAARVERAATPVCVALSQDGGGASSFVSKRKDVAMATYKIVKTEKCTGCGGAGFLDVIENQVIHCCLCGGCGEQASEVDLEAALRDLGIMDRLEAVEQESKSASRIAGLAAQSADAMRDYLD